MRASIWLTLFACASFLVAGEHAEAQDFKKLVMPGRVIAGHADIEGDCGVCHSSDDAVTQPALCVECHEDVGLDRANGSGFHGKFLAAASNECAVCHTDHEGRDADIVQAISSLFDHRQTDFPLLGQHLGLSCADCHAPDAKRRDATLPCGSCHTADDMHGGALGQECQNCHVTDNWQETRFNHALFAFALTGGHAEVACVDCHRGNVFAGTAPDCVSCHAVDDVHGGAKGATCGACHDNASWQGIGFDHFGETGFALAEGHQGLDCMDCHNRPDYRDGLSGACADCHAGEDTHQGNNGAVCESCHATTDWADWFFTHAGLGFDLNFRHAELQCAACHKGSISEPVSARCQSCHSFSDTHVGQMAEDCGTCHQESGWAAAVMFDHDLSGFPLTGLHAIAPCESCHDSNRFHDAPEECVDCHLEDDTHSGSLGEDCGSCHSSNAWRLTDFDHLASTGFSLEGAHAVASCSSCHSDSAADLGDVPSTCGGCHRNDDIHRGQLGTRCDSCHNSTTFTEIEQR